MPVTIFETGEPAAVAAAPVAVEAPVQSVVNAAAAKSLTARDSRGRTFVIKRPGPVERMRILRALGPELSAIESYVGYAMLGACVRQIDGEALAIPASNKEFEVLIARLGEEGLEAVAAAFKAEQDESDKVQTDVLAAAKNS